jgi:tetratricopeptide (TPR) repeat protein
VNRCVAFSTMLPIERPSRSVSCQTVPAALTSPSTFSPRILPRASDLLKRTAWAKRQSDRNGNSSERCIKTGPDFGERCPLGRFDPSPCRRGMPAIGGAVGREEEAIAWLRRSIETNRNYSLSHFFLAAALARIGRLSEARFEAQAGLAINPTFSISRFRASEPAGNANAVAGTDRVVDGLRKAELPEE